MKDYTWCGGYPLSHPRTTARLRRLTAPAPSKAAILPTRERARDPEAATGEIGGTSSTDADAQRIAALNEAIYLEAIRSWFRATDANTIHAGEM